MESTLRDGGHYTNGKDSNSKEGHHGKEMNFFFLFPGRYVWHKCNGRLCKVPDYILPRRLNISKAMRMSNGSMAQILEQHYSTANNHTHQTDK